MARYRSKMILEAWIFDPSIPKPEGFPSEVIVNPFRCDRVIGGCVVLRGHAHIQRDGGVLVVAPGDYVVRNSDGQYYPYAAAQFDKLYEKVEHA